MSEPSQGTKKEMILEVAEDLGVPRFTPAELEQIRRRMIARFGATAKTSADYIAEVLTANGCLLYTSRCV